MAVTLNKFGLIVPSPTTRMANLGSELLGFGQSIEDVLAGFDYDGADPNLVLSRVASLENTAPRVLATSASYLTETQTITLAEPISAQRNGIMMIWSYYSGSAAQNSHFNHTPIHKYQLALPGSGQVTVKLESSALGATRKFVYVTDNTLTGHAQNAGSGGTGMVLRAVVGM